MGKLGATVSAITFLGALGACLTGCPVWDGGSGGGGTTYPVADSGVTDTPPLTTTCTSNTDCLDGYCDSFLTTHSCVTSTSCADGAACPSGYYCDSRMVCVPGCATSAQCPSGQFCSSGTCTAGCASNTDCTRLASGLVCNTTTGTCGPSGLCSSNTDCSGTTPVCLGGTCQAASSQCQFDYQCTGGAQCANGQCVQGCSATSTSNCAAGQVCVNDFCQYPTSGTCTPACASGSLCVTGACLAVCTTSTTCATGQVCTGGVCRVDTSPHPACTIDGNCAPNSTCFMGACRANCPSPGSDSSGGCNTVDVEFDVCTAEPTGQNLCSSSSEAMPQCGSPFGSTTPLPACPAGQACVDARCQ